MAGTSPHFEPECAGPHHTSAQQAYNTRSGGYRPTEGVEGWSERGRTIRTFSTRLVLNRLAKNGYVARSTGLELIHYRIPAAAKMLSGITFDRR